MYALQFAHNQILVAQDKDNLEYMKRKLFYKYLK